MMRPLGTVLSPLLGALFALTAFAEEPIATFSIVGFDAETGELGVAVQSRFFAVGSVVPWARAGVGAIATQAFGNTTYGPRGLALLESGMAVRDVVKELTSMDPDRERRQLGIVDAQGNSMAFTGAECQAWAGHEFGPNFSAQGNILVSEATVQAMATAFRESPGMLGERLMKALEAGQEAGGDSRGMQSAAIVVVKEAGGYGGFNDRYCDLRVDDHTTPIAELRRLFDMWKIQALVFELYGFVEAGDFEQAVVRGREAIELDPTDGESWFHLACAQSRGGMTDDALETLDRAIALDATLAKRALGDSDLTPLAQEPRFLELTKGAR